MATISRRQFVLGTAAAGAAAFAGRLGRAAEETPRTKKRGSDVVTLGKSGIQTTILGIGTGTVGGSQQRALGEAGFTKLVRHALDCGLRYVDTADNYRMHYLVSVALKGVSSDKYFIQTKTTAKHPEVAKADIERFRRELGVQTLDTLLMHCMTKGGWDTDMRPVMDVLYEAKEKGRVRAVGVSCHGYPPLVTSSECDWIDVHLVRINPFGDKMDETPEKVAAEIKKMHDRGHGVLGMKIFGETGFDSAEKRLQSLKYVLGLGTVDAFTIGFVSTEQIDETLAMIEQATA
ncbi:MAG TPA: aldo/keto reductase [Candidatus Anammoximicrobium sp.]|nr:aldo/keto reductase [Candidatus Anammoximicrobium sp.]